MFTKETYIARRNKLKTDVGGGLIVLPGNEEVGMNYKDNIYHFRQDSTFLYFTGIDLPNLFFVIDVDNNTETLFGDDLTVDQIVWTGPVAPLSVYTAKSGIDNLQSYTTIETIVKKAIQQKQSIHFLNPYRGEIMVRMSELLSQSYQQIKQDVSLVLTKAIIAPISGIKPVSVGQL